MRKIARHLSYANVMSTLSVFLLLGGATALAAKKQSQKIGSTQIKASAVTAGKIKNGAVITAKLKNGAVTSDKLADGSVSGAKLGEESVSTGKLAADVVTGDKVNEATLGEVPFANSANPGLFAKITGAAVVDAANSKGLTSSNVSKAATGVYCITPPSFSPRGGQVTPERSAGLATSANLTISGGPNCASPKVQVETFVAGAGADLGFYLELYR